MTVGGFAHNKNLLKKYVSEFPVQHCISRPGCSGNMLESFEESDVQLAHMGDLWQTESVLGISYRPVSASDITGSASVWHINGDSAFVVDTNGKRCYDESAQYSMRSKWYRSPDKEIAIYIFDKRTIKRFGGLMGTWSAHLPYLAATSMFRPSFILEGKNIENLTDKLSDYLKPFQQRINCELSADFSSNLYHTIKRYNGFAKSGIDEDFHRGSSITGQGWRAKRAKDNHYPNKTMYPVSTEGPYYALALCLSCFNTKGGIQTNEHAQALRKDDTAIPGLYAAGNCAASPSNTGYVLSTIGPAMTFSYVAANHIVNKEGEGLVNK